MTRGGHERKAMEVAAYQCNRDEHAGAFTGDRFEAGWDACREYLAGAKVIEAEPVLDLLEKITALGYDLPSAKIEAFLRENGRLS